MTIRKWLTGFMATTLFAAAMHVHAALPPALQALVDAGDVDGAAAQIAATIAQGGGNAGADSLMADLARSNPDIAGAVVNATIRALSGSGQSPAQTGSVLRNLVAGALTGLNDVIAPADVTTYAENLATNVRQSVAAVSGGNQVVANNLLADARAGVGQSAQGSGGGQNAAAQVLRGDLQTRLAGSIDAGEVQQAPIQQPVVVVREQIPAQPQQQPQQRNSVPQPTVEENPQRDNLSPT